MTTADNGWAARAITILPGLLIAGLVALAAVAFERGLAVIAPGGIVLPAVVIALFLGMAASRIAARPAFEPGLGFTVKHLLRWAIALLGARIALGDIVALGVGTAVLIVGAMVATIVATVWLARRLGLGPGMGALAGAATAVCGASAALATATVLPSYPSKSAEVMFAVIAANALSTLVMLAYPPLALALDMAPDEAGILLGGTIHDMAQVVAAGYLMSEPVGNAAVVVKLFRVFLLLPVVLCIGWWLGRQIAGEAGASDGSTPRPNVPVPLFAIGFLALVVINTAAPSVPVLGPVFLAMKPWLAMASTGGLLLAIAALGLGTSLTALAGIGWRHVALVVGATLVILILVLGGLFALRLGDTQMSPQALGPAGSLVVATAGCCAAGLS